MTLSSILRNYIDILNEQQSPQVKVPPIPKLPAQDGDPGDGTKVYTNPDGTRSYAGSFGTFTYDKAGKAIKYSTPDLGGLSKTIDLQTGLVDTDYQSGALKVSAKQRPDQSTVTSASTTIGDRTVSGDQGIGFGGAGGDVGQGGNILYSVTGPEPDDKTQESSKQSFAGRKPTSQELGAAMKESNEMSLREEIENEGVFDSAPKVDWNKRAKELFAKGFTEQQVLQQLIKEGCPARQAPVYVQAGQLEEEQRVSDIEKGVADIEKGNYVRGAVGVAKGVNQTADAAGLSLVDKLKMGWMFAKAGVRGLITGLKSGDAGAGANAAAASLVGEVIPEVHKYVNGPNFDQEFEAGVMKMKDSPDPKNKEMYEKYMSGELTANSFKGYINRQYDNYLKMQKGQSASDAVDDTMYTTPSAPTTTSSYSAQTPAPAESIQYKNKSLLEHIEEIENEGPLSSGDYFQIELSEDEGIETWVIAEWTESVLIEADATTLKLLEAHGCTFHDELTEAEYQGRKVPLGKRMPGDVKKSKVYVRKPNGKVVKVNFGDKKMKIKKTNPARRKSFRARHNCDNPGPRWKARYWSCKAW